MSWKIKPVESVVVKGTSYAGIIRCDFEVLKANFGTPGVRPITLDEVSCCWNLSLRLDDGLWLVFTIYNWKDKTEPKENEMWHVGSMHVDDHAIFDFLRRVLKGYRLITRR